MRTNKKQNNENKIKKVKEINKKIKIKKMKKQNKIKKQINSKNKQEKAYFCPKCKSFDVEKRMSMGIILGTPQMWKCNKCGFKSYIFPQIEISKVKEKKQNNNIKNLIINNKQKADIKTKLKIKY